MRITLNGEHITITNGFSLKDLLTEFQLESEKVAIERNLHIIPNNAYESTPLNEGDQIEIVHFIGGG
jgi:thiamine biosynthesis protein ThiS